MFAYFFHCYDCYNNCDDYSCLYYGSHILPPQSPRTAPRMEAQRSLFSYSSGFKPALETINQRNAFQRKTPGWVKHSGYPRKNL